MVTPAYAQENYVDHELSANLDSTFAFEGPEKLLELWIWNHESGIPPSVSKEGLRSIPLEEWVKILDLVNCKILSKKSSRFMDAYLLSELSLFVFPHKLILKTCGTTTTLACLEELFKMIRDVTKTDVCSKNIFKIFYSRRSFMFPEKQIHVHRDWKDEVKHLNEFFINGKSYVVGDFTSDDHWYLYMGGQHNDDSGESNGLKDQTFEILMTKLNPVKAKQFFTARNPGSESLVEHSGSEEDGDLGHDIGMDTMATTELDSIFEPVQPDQLPSPSSEIDGLELNERKGKSKFEFIHDAFSFTPCGYSSNSISKNKGGYYYTLHITPEAGWSYASFETNFPFDNSSEVTVMDVLLKVLGIFEPGNFSVTLIHELAKHSELSDDEYSLASSMSSLGSIPMNRGHRVADNVGELANCDQFLGQMGYKKQEKIIYDLKNEYSLLYLNFEKKY